MAFQVPQQRMPSSRDTGRLVRPGLVQECQHVTGCSKKQREGAKQRRDKEQERERVINAIIRA